MSDKTFWVLERDGRYIAVSDALTIEGGFTRRADWTDDVKEARHFPTQQYADITRKTLGHPFWMADPIEHAWIGPDAYANGLAGEIGKLKGELSSAIARAEAAEAKVRELEPKAAIHDTAVANGWKEQIAFQRAYAERSTLRQQAEGMAGALEEIYIMDTEFDPVSKHGPCAAKAKAALSAFRTSSRGEG